jgi:DNA-binding transcriptional MerR regulator
MATAPKRKRPFWLTTRVARRLGCSSESVRQYERKGWLHAMKTETGTRLFDPDDVERFAQQREAQRREREHANAEPQPAA